MNERNFEPETGDDDSEFEPPAEDIDSSAMFCRFSPMQIDRMASHLLGEPPLCERWISRDGKTAVLYGLRLKTAKRKQEDKPDQYVPNMVEKWIQRFQKTKVTI